MKFFVDFDDVIFNTKKFKEDLINVFAAHGVSEELYHQTYVREKNIKTYDPYLQIEKIADVAKNINKKNIADGLRKFLDYEIGKYIFEDFIEFSKIIGKENIYILSFGNYVLQEEKIKKSNADKLVIKYLITEVSKSEKLNEFYNENPELKKEAMCFIDDRSEQIDVIKGQFSNIKTILMQREEGRYKDQVRNQNCDEVVSDFTEVIKVLQKVR